MNEIITKKYNMVNNTKKNHKYKCIFHYPVAPNDCINSLDIIDDKIIIGTIMGDVSLLRVDKDNLLVNYKEKYKNINSLFNGNINNKIFDNNIDERYEINNKGIQCIHLKKKKHNGDFHFDEGNNKEKLIKLKAYINFKKLKESKGENEIQTIDRTNDKTKENIEKKKIKLIKLNNKSYDNSKNFLKSNKLSSEKNINIKKILIKNKKKEENNEYMNIRYDNTNIENTNSLEDRKNSSEEDNINYFKKDLLNIKIKKFPQVTKLINKSNENIPCVKFDTDDKINISIGDFELICMEKMSEFNINDKNSTYNYFKIKNYKNDSQHLKHCENCTCMMNSSNFLMIYTQFAEFNSILKSFNVKYKNRNLRTYEMITGKIKLSNYCVPFDFDGDRFLFLDYISKEKRKICIYYTISKMDIFEYNIGKEYGHISHMKIINKDENKIFLCRNYNECEIHLIDENFTCIESWKHIGNDTISCFIYIKDSKITKQFKNRINIKKYTEEKDYDNFILINNCKGNILKKNKNKILNKRNRNLNMDKNQGSSTILNININNNSALSSSNNFKNNIKCLNNTENIENNKKNKNLNSFLNKYENSSKRAFNNSDKKLKKNIDGVDVYNKKKYNENDSYRINIVHKEKIYETNIIKKNTDNSYSIDLENENINNNYYIITLDKNGNVNLYQKEKYKKIFNLYEIENIEEKYKEKQFFSIGFPYFIIMNELYIGLTTDYGLFVISNSLD